MANFSAIMVQIYASLCHISQQYVSSVKHFKEIYHALVKRFVIDNQC